MKGKIISITSACTVLCAGAVAVALYANTFGTGSTPATQAAVDISPDISIYEEIPTESIAETKIAKTEIRELAKTVNPREATKDDIYHMMLNTIDYFDKASGTFYYPTGKDLKPGKDLNLINSVEFQTELSTTTTYSHEMEAYVGGNTIEEVIKNFSELKDIEEIIWNKEYYCNGDDEVEMDYMKRSYVSSTGNTTGLDDVLEIPDDKRITIEEDGEPCYNYRANPTNMRYASMCLTPQELTLGFLAEQDLWEIEGTEKINGRLCYHIIGQADNDYGRKLHSLTFDFWVDTNTGVLLKYIGYDENGDIGNYVYTENISFEDKAEEVQAYSDNLVKGFKEEKPY